MRLAGQLPGLRRPICLRRLRADRDFIGQLAFAASIRVALQCFELSEQGPHYRIVGHLRCMVWRLIPLPTRLGVWPAFGRDQV